MLDTITQYIQNMLLRDPRPNEAENGAQLVQSGQLTLEEARQQLIDFAESTELVQPMLLTYQAIYGRTPDAGGFDYWVNVYRDNFDLNDPGNPNVNEGLVAVLKAFVDPALTPEFVDRYGADPSPGDFVEASYTNVLNRQPDQGGLDFWTQRYVEIRDGIDAADPGLSEEALNVEVRAIILEQFVSSPEYRQATQDAVNVFLHSAGVGDDWIYDASLWDVPDGRPLSLAEAEAEGDLPLYYNISDDPGDIDSVTQEQADIIAGATNADDFDITATITLTSGTDFVAPQEPDGLPSGTTFHQSTSLNDRIEGVVSPVIANNTLDPDDVINGGEGRDTLAVALEGSFDGFTTGGLQNIEVISLRNETSIDRTFNAEGIEGVEEYRISINHDSSTTVTNIEADVIDVTLASFVSGTVGLHFDGTTSANINAIPAVSMLPQAAIELELFASDLNELSIESQGPFELTGGALGSLQQFELSTEGHFETGNGLGPLHQANLSGSGSASIGNMGNPNAQFHDYSLNLTAAGLPLGLEVGNLSSGAGHDINVDISALQGNFTLAGVQGGGDTITVNASGAGGDVSLGSGFNQQEGLWAPFGHVDVDAFWAEGDNFEVYVAAQTAEIIGMDTGTNVFNVQVSDSATISGGISNNTFNIRGDAGSGAVAEFTLSGSIANNLYNFEGTGVGNDQGAVRATITDFARGFDEIGGLDVADVITTGATLQDIGNFLGSAGFSGALSEIDIIGRLRNASGDEIGVAFEFRDATHIIHHGENGQVDNFGDRDQFITLTGVTDVSEGDLSDMFAPFLA